MAIRCCGEAVIKVRLDKQSTYVATIAAGGYTFLIGGLVLPSDACLVPASAIAFSTIARLAVAQALGMKNGDYLDGVGEFDDEDRPVIRRTPRAPPEQIPNTEPPAEPLPEIS